MSVPRVSVLLPAYDAESTIGLALKSIARQSFRSWECVVVDDGSQDATAALVRAAAERDPRFRLLQVPHGGIVSALTAGLSQCRGAIVARMDADDVAHGRRLALQLAALDAESGWAAVGCHVRIFPRRRVSGGLANYERWLNSIGDEHAVRRERFVECPIAHPSLTIRREVLSRYGYRNAGWAEDYDLLLRLLADGVRIGVVPRRLLGWRDADSRLSRTSAACAPDRMVACKAEYLAKDFLADAQRYVLWGYGDTGKELCRALEAHGRRPAAIVELHPGRLGQRIAGAPVIPPAELPRWRKEKLLVSVARAGPRGEIRAALDAMDFVEERDFLCCA